MKDHLDEAKETLRRTAALFLILWLISAVTDFLGVYEYEVEFLQLAVGFYLLSRIPTAFRERYSAGKKFEKFFTNLGWPLVGLWIAFKIVRWIGWFGLLEIGVDIDYLLVAGVVCLFIGYTAKSFRYKAGYWAMRGRKIAEKWAREKTKRFPKRKYNGLRRKLDEDYVEDRIPREEYLERKKELEGE